MKFTDLYFLVCFLSYLIMSCFSLCHLLSFAGLLHFRTIINNQLLLSNYQENYINISVSFECMVSQTSQVLWQGSQNQVNGPKQTQHEGEVKNFINEKQL